MNKNHKKRTWLEARGYVESRFKQNIINSDLEEFKTLSSQRRRNVHSPNIARSSAPLCRSFSACLPPFFLNLFFDWYQFLTQNTQYFRNYLFTIGDLAPCVSNKEFLAWRFQNLVQQRNKKRFTLNMIEFFNKGFESTHKGTRKYLLTYHLKPSVSVLSLSLVISVSIFFLSE